MPCSDKDRTHLEQAFDGGDLAFIRHKQDDVVVFLDDGVAVGNDHFFAANQ